MVITLDELKQSKAFKDFVGDQHVVGTKDIYTNQDIAYSTWYVVTYDFEDKVYVLYRFFPMGKEIVCSVDYSGLKENDLIVILMGKMGEIK